MYTNLTVYTAHSFDVVVSFGTAGRKKQIYIYIYIYINSGLLKALLFI